MSVYQWIDGFGRVVSDREASATGCDQKIDMVFSVAKQTHCLLDRENIVRNYFWVVNSPFTVALVGENLGESIAGFVC